MVYACHCTDCQKRSGAAFGLSVWVPRASISLASGKVALQVSRNDAGREHRVRVCATCMTRLWSEPMKRPEVGILRGGAFHFGNQQNPEVLIKVLNGCVINDRFWVFFAATTNVEYTLQVRDTQTGQQRTYSNALGIPAQPVQDTAAFTCAGTGSSAPAESETGSAGGTLGPDPE